MRDLLVLFLTMGGAAAGFFRPWLGVLALAMFAYLNPHRYAWGFSVNMPVYFIVFAGTMAGLVFNGRDRQPFPWTRETKLFVLLLAWFTLTTFWNPDFPDAARTEWVKVMKVYVGIFPTFWLITTRERLRWLIIVIALSFGLIGLKGGLFAFGSGFNYRVYGPPTTFYGGNNEIALALNMMLPLLLLCAKEVQSKNARMFFYIVFFFSVCSIVSSWSRGGLLTLCAVLGAIVLTGRRKWLSIPLVVVAVMLATPNLPAQWFGRMQTIETYQEDASVQGRFQAWNYAWERAKESPLTGGGFETFLDVQHDSHSAYFQIMGHHGFIALGLWLLLLLGTIAALERIRRRARIFDGAAWMKDYARAIQISLLGYAVGGAFLGVAYWDIFYHLVGIAVLLKVMLREAAEHVGPVGGLAERE
jgi:putative inorganic carbon (HCO3(-)) transporter